MAVLVPKGISGHDSFDIVLSAGGRNKQMTCDCRKDDRVEYQVVARDITLSAAAGTDDRNNRMQITYLVMPNAVQATLEIKLRLTASEGPTDIGDSNYKARGTIYAYISDIGADNCPIVLFTKSQPIGFTSSSSSSGWTLKLDRSASADSAPLRVPQGKQLQIDMRNLHIIMGPDGEELKMDMVGLYFLGPQVSSNRVVENGNNHIIIFDINDSSAAIIPIGDGSRVLQVKVNWKGGKAKRIEPDVVCKNIADKDELTGCIAQLRQKISNECPDGELLSKHPMYSHPVLKSQPQRWIHVELQAVEDKGKGEESATTTLAIRDDKCYGFGFLNQSGVWYDLGLGVDDNNKALPAEYNSVPLGVYYKDILGVGGVNYWDQVVGKLNSEGLDFATRAVRILSRYPDVKKDEDPRLALAGIILMVCESAKLKSIYEYFIGTWGNWSTITDVQKNDIRNWEERSRALLYWRDHGYNDDKWGEHMKKIDPQSLGVRKDALRIVHLVFSYCPRQIDMEHTIDGNAANFTGFIKDLRSKLGNHEHPENVVHGGWCRPVLGRFRVGQPARWFHIKLRLSDGASTTLAVRDDTVHVRGFTNQTGTTWFDLGYPGGSDSKILPEEYKSKEVLGWGIVYPDILQVRSQEEAVVELESAVRARDYAAEAVRTLSGYQGRGVHNNQEEEKATRLALASLTLMVCGSARLDTVRKHFIHRVWGTDTPLEFTPELRGLLSFSNSWASISRALLRWKKAGYNDSEWNPEGRYYKGIGMKSGDDALADMALVFKPRLA